MLLKLIFMKGTRIYGTHYQGLRITVMTKISNWNLFISNLET